MNARFQFGAYLAGLSLAAALLVPCANAQSKDRPAPRPSASAPHGAAHPSRDNSGRASSNGGYHSQNAPRHNSNADRQPSYDNRSRDNRAQSQPRTAPTPAPNPQERLRNMSPQDRQRLAQREEQLRHLTPAQQQELRNRAQVWQNMTPGQRDHIRNDVLPKWKELPPNRQKAIQQRLGVLRNMPESARNNHLSDPNFTRGMNDDDKQMLRDLSHEHIGAPDEHAQRPPQDQ